FVTRLGSGGFVADLREKRGQAVVILLAPFLKRVMVTLGALQSHSEEKLRRVLEFGLRFANALVPDDRGIILEVARGSEDIAHEPVVRFVLQQAVANPGMKRVGATGLFRFRASIAQKRAPFVGEIIGV